MMTGQEIAAKVGKHVLFVGVEAVRFTTQDYILVARFAKSLGFDSIAVKVADGTIKWYRNTQQLDEWRKAVMEQGVGLIYYMYSYAPVFGSEQAEADLLKELMTHGGGLACADMEVQWDGKFEAATRFAQCMAGAPGDLIVSTWADPVQQNWLQVIRNLAPCVSAWSPQQYTNWLVTQEAQLTGDGVLSDRILPTCDIAEFFGGANNPLLVAQTAAQRGHESLWVWEYQGAQRNPALARSILALHQHSTPTPAPVSHPVSDDVTYNIQEGDTLTGIAGKFHITNWFQELYLPNKVALDAAARKRGMQDSQNGTLIYPGTVLLWKKAA